MPAIRQFAAGGFKKIRGLLDGNKVDFQGEIVDLKKKAPRLNLKVTMKKLPAEKVSNYFVFLEKKRRFEYKP